MSLMRGPTSALLPALLLAPVVVPVLVLVVVLAQPARGQDVASTARDDGGMEGLEEMTDEELSAEGFVDGSYVIRDVPYAMLIDSLFDAMVHWQPMDGWWQNHGLDSESVAVQELEALAAEVERTHPARRDRVVPDDGARPEEFEAANTANRSLRDTRYRALGVAFGRWLESRRAEGYPPEFFLDRLVAGMGVAAFSTESMEDVRAEVRRDAAEFEVGLRQAMQSVPRRLTVAGWEDD